MNELIQVSITCIENNNSFIVDVLEHSDKKIKVFVPQSRVTFELARNSKKQPYLGQAVGIKFKTNGKISK